ncbi:MAG: FAD binding domain-containing protein [Rhodovibrionaceae bacterium]
MKPAPFDLLIADSLEEALACLHEHGEDARIIAGGQSLMAMLNMRLAHPSVLVDVTRLRDLSYIRCKGDWLEVGATTTQAELLAWPELATRAPLLAQALPYVGHFQTRNRGTVCGSLCHADPSSEIPLALATLGGEVVLKSRKGKRVLAAQDFQTGMLTTARRPDEMVVAARFRLQEDLARFGFREVARRHGDFAIVSIAAMKTAKTLCLGVGGVAERPTIQTFDAQSAEDLEAALNAFAWQLGGSDDIHASARYRREMVRRLGHTLLQEVSNAAAS